MAYILSENIELQPLEDEIVLLDLNQNAYYSLNGTARFFLEKILEGQSNESIVMDAMAEFEVSEQDQVMADLLALIDELQKLGIIRSVQKSAD